MEYQQLIPPLALLVAIYSAYLQRKQVRLTTADQEELPGISKPTPWWRAPTVIAVFVLALLTWIPWAVTSLRAPTIPAIGIAGWGGFSQELGSMPLGVVVNEANPNIRLMGIAFHYTAETDFTDVSDLQKSAVYDARKGTQIIMIKANDKFIDEFRSGKHNRTNYMLLAIPTKLGNPHFSTLREAYALGIQTLWSGTGPP